MLLPLWGITISSGCRREFFPGNVMVYNETTCEIMNETKHTILTRNSGIVIFKHYQYAINDYCIFEETTLTKRQKNYY